MPIPTYAPPVLNDEEDDPDRLKRAPVAPPEQILSEALAGRSRQQAPTRGLPLEQTLGRSAAGPAPQRDERKQKILRLMTLGGALGTVLSGGAGNLGAIGAGLARGGAEGLRQQDEDYALQTEGWQEQMQQIAEANAGVRERNAERQFERFMAEEKAGREREAGEREAKQKQQEIRTRADAEARAKARADVLKEKLLRGLPLSEKEQAEIEEIRSRRRENEAQASASYALRDKRRQGRGETATRSGAEKRLREIGDEIYRIQQEINEVNGLDPKNAKRMRTHGQRLMDLVDERVRLEAENERPGKEANASDQTAGDQNASDPGGDAGMVRSESLRLQETFGTRGAVQRISAMQRAGQLSRAEANRMLDALGID